VLEAKIDPDRMARCWLRFRTSDKTTTRFLSLQRGERCPKGAEWGMTAVEREAVAELALRNAPEIFGRATAKPKRFSGST
jgi:hypothetical protein